MFASPPVFVSETRSVTLVWLSRRKTSGAPLVSFATRFAAVDVNATYRPVVETPLPRVTPFIGWAPVLETPTRPTHAQPPDSATTAAIATARLTCIPHPPEPYKPDNATET